MSLPTEPPRVSPAVGSRGKRVQTPPQPRVSPAPLPPPPPPPQASKEQLAALAHAAKGVEALGVLVQYLMFRVSICKPGQEVRRFDIQREFMRHDDHSVTYVS